jgi:YHS domain-containing protein
MFRALVYILVSLLLLTFIRSVVGLIMKTMSELMGTSTPPSTPQPKGAPQGGELRRDPVCGTYIPETTAVHLKVRGETLHFCSTACRDKYKA